MAKKLGPTATYHNLAGDAPTIEIAGVVFEDGDTVDLVEELGERQATPILEKLAGNHFFDVENGTADHEAIRQTVSGQSTVERRKPAARKPAVKKAVQRQIEREDAEHPPEPDAPTETAEEEIPDDVKMPDTPVLENTSRPRLPRARS